MPSLPVLPAVVRSVVNRNCQRPTDQDCRKSAVELVPGKSTASSKAAADLRAPCGGLQSTLRAGGGRTRARSAALEGSSAPAFHRLPAGRVSGAAAARRRRGMGETTTNQLQITVGRRAEVPSPKDVGGMTSSTRPACTYCIYDVLIITPRLQGDSAEFL